MKKEEYIKKYNNNINYFSITEPHNIQNAVSRIVLQKAKKSIIDMEIIDILESEHLSLDQLLLKFNILYKPVTIIFFLSEISNILKGGVITTEEIEEKVECIIRDTILGYRRG